MMNMNNEDFDRKMEFILEQQAQFAADIQRLQESQAHLHEKQVQFQQNQTQLQESQAHTDQVVIQMATAVGDAGEVVTRLAKVTHAGFKEVNAKINALVDAQIRTEESLRDFIAVVDRRFSEGRHGN